MGRVKQQLIELQDFEAERALDFDLRDADSPEWWREQDAEMQQAEKDQIELAAEIQEYRHGGIL